MSSYEKVHVYAVASACQSKLYGQTYGFERLKIEMCFGGEKTF